jgi:hypothetical protein
MFAEGRDGAEAGVRRDALDGVRRRLEQKLSAATRARISHWSGVVPVCSRNRRVRLRMLVAPRRAMSPSVSSAWRFFWSQSSSGAREEPSGLGAGGR